MNGRILTGIILIIPVLAAAIFGGLIAPYDMDFSEPIVFEKDGEETEIIVPPFPPSKEHPMGTDGRGKDILSLLIFGARWTVATTILIALVKTLLAGLIGLISAFRQPIHFRGLKSTPLNALPQIVFLYFILSEISINFPFNVLILISVFGLLVIAFGTPAGAAAVEATTRELMKKEYYSAAKASGAGKLYLTVHHIMPFLKERLLTLFISDMISVLNTIGQMGVFGIFLGATVMTFSPISTYSRLNEWAGLVGLARYYIYSEQWILLAPLSCYMIFLISLYMLLEGFRIKFRKDYRLV